MVSLVPSVTETLLAWGIEPVACTRFCEQPTLQHVGGTKDPDLDAIVDLQPDLVVLDREENRLEDHDALVDRGVGLEVLHVAGLSDVEGEVGRLASRLDVDYRPPTLGAAPPLERVAFVPIWKRPWMTIGRATYGASVLAHLGIDVAFGDLDDTYPEVSDQQILEVGADLVIGPSEPYPFAERHVPELSAFGPTVLVDGRDLFWWGVRTPGALERLSVRVG
ncbi:MAG: helical backbone metal receptor [Actinomycetota bacterium]|nr:helical backbone metal receptor [Actinomycetota bacterium]